ncbi:MAG: hypothetical protein FD130_808, partial [Halothiobacillaceae bacterium]
MGLPVVPVNIALLDPPPGVVEVWCVAQPVVASGQQGSVRYRYTGDLLFGSVTLHESDFTDLSIATAGTSPL